MRNQNILSTRLVNSEPAFLNLKGWKRLNYRPQFNFTTQSCFDFKYKDNGTDGAIWK